MLNTKALGLAVLFALGGTSFAVAGTDTDGGAFNQAPWAYSAAPQLQEGRTVYVAPATNHGAPVQSSLQNGSNAPAR